MKHQDNTFQIPVLETERLYLIPWDLKYAQDMLLFASNEKVISSAGGWKLITDVNKAKAKIISYINRNSLEWAIALRTDESFKIIGSIGMRAINSIKEYNLCMDFGYLLAEEYWRQGICTEASQKLMHYSFIGLKCDAMTVSHRVFNIQSKRVIEKCKFELRGIFPKNNQDKPDSKACYILTREDYINIYKASDLAGREYHKTKQMRDFLLKQKEINPKSINQPQKQPKQIKGSPYSLDNPIRKIDCINYIKEPTGYLCGQSCVAMLANVSVDEVIKIIGTDKGTNKQDLKKALNYYGINYAPKSMKFDPRSSLPELCVIRMILPGYSHWGVYYKGTYYDPEFGVLNECPPNAKIFQVWEIYP